MRAILVERHGGPEVLTDRELGQPSPGPGEILVRHEVIGVNYIDTYYRDGTYTAPLPFVPGQEAAGSVAAIGEGVDGTFRLEQRVAYATSLGACAEYAVVPAEKLVPLPDGLTNETAAALLLQGMAATYLTHETHPLSAEDTVVVHAGAGGLGGLLVQLAAGRGATVIATASSPEKRAVAEKHGANHTLPYLAPDELAEAVRDLAGRGATVVYDSVGAATFESSLSCLDRRGLLVLCGLSSGPVGMFDVERLRTLGSLTLTRPSLGDHVRNPEALRATAAQVFTAAAEGRLRALINARMPLAETWRAHEALESRSTTGKILLVP